MLLESLLIFGAVYFPALEEKLLEAITPPVLISENNIVVSVIERVDNGFSVKTPCGKNAFLSGGEYISEVDIVIDPGHGGKDPGATGREIFEKDLTLQISKELKSALENIGYSVLLTREGDYYIGLYERNRLANKLEAKLFLSIHFNSTPNTINSETPGLEVYYQYENKESIRLSGLIWEEVYHTLSEADIIWSSNKDAGVKYKLLASGADFFGVLRNVNDDVSSALIEVGFLTNPLEEELYQNVIEREKITQSFVRAIERFIKSTDDVGSGFVEPIDPTPRIFGTGVVICEDPVL